MPLARTPLSAGTAYRWPQGVSGWWRGCEGGAKIGIATLCIANRQPNFTQRLDGYSVSQRAARSQIIRLWTLSSVSAYGTNLAI